MLLKYFRKYILSFILVPIILGFLPQTGEAFSLSKEPILFLQRATNLVIEKVSEAIIYFISKTGSVTEEMIPFVTNLSNVIKEKPVENLISVGTSTIPNTQKINSPKVDTEENTQTSSIPGLIFEDDSISNKVSNYSAESEILKYTNKERKDNSLDLLMADRVLDTIAGLRADDLFTNQYFDHNSPDGKSVSDLAKKYKYNYLLIGENLALGNFQTEQDIVTAWMDSPGHRENILNGRYKKLGVAVKEGVFDSERVIIAVQVFALPTSICPEPSPAIKNLIDSSSLAIKKMQAEAQVIFNNLNTLKAEPSFNSSSYTQKAQDYNFMAKKINDAVISLKVMIDYYNIQVNEYNSCIKF